MNLKQLLTLVIVLIVLGAGAWFVTQKDQAALQKSSVGIGDKLVPEFPLNEVAQLQIIQSTQSLTVAKQDGIWKVQDRGNYPANFGTVSDLVRKIWEMKVTKPVPTRESRLPALQLVPPDQGDSTKLVFKDDAGQTLHTLLLGLQTQKEAPANAQFGGGGSFPDGRYVMVDGKPDNVALISDPLTSVNADPTSWLSKDFIKVQKPQSITVSTGVESNNWTLVRESETGSWSLADPKDGETLDTSKVSSANYLLSSPYFNDVLVEDEAAETALEEGRTATLRTFEGFVYDLKFGPQPDSENYALRVDVTGDFPEERTPTEDEKEEDKAKLDKEFKDKIQGYEEKLQKEQAMENWTYSVSKWTVDFLLKNRSDLLKQPEPETESASAAADIGLDLDGADAPSVDDFNPLNLQPD